MGAERPATSRPSATLKRGQTAYTGQKPAEPFLQSLTSIPLLNLQRLAGNQAVLGLIERSEVANPPAPPSSPAEPDQELPDDDADAPKDAAANPAAIQQFLATVQTQVSGITAAGTNLERTIQAVSEGKQAQIEAERTRRTEEAQAAFGEHRAQLTQEMESRIAYVQSAAATQTSELQATGEQHAAAVVTEANAQNAAVSAAANAGQSSVQVAGDQQRQRVDQQTAAAETQIRQQAAGSAGGDERGQAQSGAAAQIVNKGLSVLRNPLGAILSEIATAVRQSAARLLAAGAHVGSAIVRRATQLSAAIRSQIQKIVQKLAAQTRGVVSAMRATQARLLQSMPPAAQKFMAAIDARARSAAGSVRQTTVRVLERVRTVTRKAANTLWTRAKAIAAQAENAGAGVPRALAEATAQAIVAGQQAIAKFNNLADLLSGDIDKVVAATKDLIGDAIGHLKKQLGDAIGMIKSKIGPAVEQCVGTIREAVSKGIAAIALNMRGLSLSNSQLTTSASSVFSRAPASVSQAMQMSVDATTHQNASTIQGSVGQNISQANARIDAEYHQSLLSRIGEVLKTVFNVAKAIYKAVSSVVITGLKYIGGALLQIVSNSMGGLLDPLLDRVDDDTFNAGRDLGDKLSVILGFLEIVAGIIAILGGVTITWVGVGITVGTGGAAAVITVPVVTIVDGVLVIVGGALIIDGIVMMMTGAKGGGFRGPRLGDIDIDHVYDNHHPNGRNAQRRGPNNSLFPERWTKNDIMRAIRNAWANRKRISTQRGPGDTRILYRGVDSDSGLTIEMWYNAVTKTIETAYPVP